ncbi:MAG: hypothetical protein KA436_00240 [Oligoflexales bacterium]|nr:hypothetical protein [Oligoflexales bacterium]
MAATPASHKLAFDVQLRMAKISYDKREFRKAYEYAVTAYNINPESEEASLTLGYIEISLAGLDTFSLIKKSSELSKKKSQAESLLLADDSKQSGDDLSALSDLLGITDEEFALLGTRNEEDPEFPVIIPVCAEEARSTLERLQLTTHAIQVICPFVDEDVRLLGDYRHRCKPVSFNRQKKESAHFLWVLSHILEAFAFQKVLNFSSHGQGKSNLERRVEKLKDVDLSDPQNITQLVSNLSGIESLLQKVLPIAGACSEEFPTTQMTGMINDLLAISASATKLPGAPDSMSKALAKIGDKIKLAQDGAGNIPDIFSRRKALKSDFTKSIASTLKGKIESVDQSQYSSEAQKKLCSSLGDISSGTTRPSFCT